MLTRWMLPWSGYFCPTVKHGVLGSKLFIEIARDNFSEPKIISDLCDVRVLREIEILQDMFPLVADSIFLTL